MSIFMCSPYNLDIIAVSNRNQCSQDFFCCIHNAIKDGIKTLILREKDLGYAEYVALAKKVADFLSQYNIDNPVNLMLNIGRFAEKNADEKIIKQFQADTNCHNIHIPIRCILENERFNTIRQLTTGTLGMSVHTVEEAVFAQNLGADYITAGHIFETACKPGLKPRGLEFLKKVCESVNIPVYAIGGMTKENAHLAIHAGAKGICIMSGYFC